MGVGMTPKILTIDIENGPALAETWGLWDVNVSLSQLVKPVRVISWAAKWYGERRVEFRSEYHDGRDEMLTRIHQLLDEAQVVVGYNQQRFDVPHLNREFLLAQIGPPSPFQHIDLLKVARNQFKFMSNKLEHVTKQVGLEGKIKHSGHELWADCLRPDVPDATRERAWNLMRRYNKNDVTQTEKLYDIFRAWLPSTVHLGLLGGVAGDSCGRCGGTDLERRGLKATSLSTYQQYQCRNCGSWSRAKRAEQTVDVRGVQ